MRLIAGLGVKTDSELARALDTSSSNISTWKKRGGVPLAICEKIAREYGWSMDWLLYGEGSMYRQESPNTPPVAHLAEPADALSPRKKAVLDLFEALSESQQREILHALEDKKRISDIEAELQEMKLALEKLTGTA